MKDVFYGWIDTVRPIVAEKLASVVCFGDGKGNFKVNDLPLQLQIAPIFTFQIIGSDAGNKMFASGGNFFDVIPYEGRYDAQALAAFTIDRNNLITSVTPDEIFNYNGQVRDMKWLKTAKGTAVLLMAANNDSLFSLSVNSKMAAQAK